MIEPVKESYDVQINEQGEEGLVLQSLPSQDKLDELALIETQPSEPKKARGAYQIFVSENKDLKKNFDKNFMWEMSQLWKDADQETKKIFTNRAIAEKEMYEKNNKNITADTAIRESKCTDAHSLSKNVLKKIVNMDPTTAMKLKPDTYDYLTKALDHFLDTLIRDSEVVARKAGKKKVTEHDLYSAIQQDIKYSFLKDLRLNSTTNKTLKAKSREEEVRSVSREGQNQMVIEELPSEPKEVTKDQPNVKRNSLLNYFKK